MKTKIILAIFAIIFIFLQYRLWFADDGILKVFRLKHVINEMQTKNNECVKHNASLANEITTLKKGGKAIENRARSDLGMIKKGEIFYQVIK